MTGPDFTKRGPSGAQQFDPVTGAPLPPGPAAYSAVDPTLAADPFGYPGAPPTASGPVGGYPAGGYPTTGYGAPATGYQGYPAAGAPGPGYPGQQYSSPGYGPPAYSAPGQPPAGYPGGYAPIGYQLMPMYPVPQRPIRPGGATAAAVLAYVQSGFVLIGGISMFSGSAGLDSLSRGSDLSSELTVIGIITVLAGGLLIAGATTLLGRKPGLLLMGNGLSIAISLYFLVRLMNSILSFGLWVPILFAVLPVISIALACSADVRAWARARRYDQE